MQRLIIVIIGLNFLLYGSAEILQPPADLTEQAYADECLILARKLLNSENRAMFSKNARGYLEEAAHKGSIPTRAWAYFFRAKLESCDWTERDWVIIADEQENRSNLKEVKIILETHPELMELSELRCCIDLLDDSYDVKKAEPPLKTPLHKAAEKDYREAAQIALAKGADCNVADDFSRTPLHYAAEEGHYEIMSLLLERGGDSKKNDWRGETPLLVAAKKGHRRIIRLLVNYGAAVNVANTRGITPLIAAINYLADASDKDTSIIEELLDQGARVDIAETLGFTPLYWTVKAQLPSLITLLIDAGAPLYLLNPEGSYSLIDNGMTESETSIVLKKFILRDFQKCYQIAYPRIFTALCLFLRLKNNNNISLPKQIQQLILSSIAELRLDLFYCLKNKVALFYNAPTILAQERAQVTMLIAIKKSIRSVLSMNNKKRLQLHSPFNKWRTEGRLALVENSVPKTLDQLALGIFCAWFPQ